MSPWRIGCTTLHLGDCRQVLAELAPATAWVSIGPALGPPTERALAMLAEAGVTWAVLEPLHYHANTAAAVDSPGHVVRWVEALERARIAAWVKHGQPQRLAPELEATWWCNAALAQGQVPGTVPGIPPRSAP